MNLQPDYRRKQILNENRLPPKTPAIAAEPIVRSIASLPGFVEASPAESMPLPSYLELHSRLGDPIVFDGGFPVAELERSKVTASKLLVERKVGKFDYLKSDMCSELKDLVPASADEIFRLTVTELLSNTSMRQRANWMTPPADYKANVVSLESSFRFMDVQMFQPTISEQGWNRLHSNSLLPIPDLQRKWMRILTMRAEFRGAGLGGFSKCVGAGLAMRLEYTKTKDAGMVTQLRVKL